MDGTGGYLGWPLLPSLFLLFLFLLSVFRLEGTSKYATMLCVYARSVEVKCGSRRREDLSLRVGLAEPPWIFDARDVVEDIAG